MLLISEALRASAEQGACMLLITHDLELMESTCDFALRLPIGIPDAKD